MARETRQTKKKGTEPAVKLPSSRKKPATNQTDENGNENGEVEVKVEEKMEKGSRKKGSAKEVIVKTKTDLKISENGRSEDKSINLLKKLDLIQYGFHKNRRFYMRSVQDHLVDKSIKQLVCTDFSACYNRRITSIAWHDQYPFVVASASKFGDINLMCPVRASGEEMRFETRAQIEGPGPGGSITAIRFHQNDMGTIYRSSIDCTVAKVDMIRGTSDKFFDTEDYNRWFCSLDVSFHNNIVLSGDNKGTAYKFSLDGRLQNQWRLHKSKIHSIEFSKKDTNLLATSGLDRDEAVRLWDIRFLKESKGAFKPLVSLAHNVGVNCARFSPTDGSRLLTSDQRDEIRVYQGPMWDPDDYLLIKHHHKQFQHITPIKADWHPVNDYIVIGRYPPAKTEGSADKKARAIEFYNSYTGDLVDMIYPPQDIICSLNTFNPTGEYLATGMNLKLIIWKPGQPADTFEKPKGPAASQKITEQTRNALRGRRTREYSPTSDGEDDEDSSKKKKKSRTTAPAAPTRSKTATSTTTSRKKK